jgi:hypothetical protein
MLAIIVLMALISAPFIVIYAAMIADDINRGKQARRYARMMSDPAVIAAHRAAEQCKTKAKV